MTSTFQLPKGSAMSARARAFSTGFSYSHGPDDWTPNGYESGVSWYRTSDETERYIAQTLAVGPSDTVIVRVTR